VLAFVLVAAAIFFVIVKPMNVSNARRAPADQGPVTRECPECLSVIPGTARRCSQCTAQVTPIAAT
jgi:large conductance mechanosensitive channel